MSVTLISDLSEISSGLPDAVAEALEAEAEKIAQDAKQRVPVRTGNLRDSIEVVPYNEPGFVGFRVVADARSLTGKYNAPYAHMVEYGSVHNEPARPFLVPALEAGQDTVLDAVTNAIQDASNV